MAGLIVTAIAVLILFFVVRHFRTVAIAKRGASEIVNRVMPVWAAQGPFASGEESSEAMRRAYCAVFDEEKAKSMEGVIHQHAASYDAQPHEWEDTRRTALAAATPETSEYVEQIEIHKFQDMVAVLIMTMSEGEENTEGLSRAVGRLYETWGDKEMRERIIAMICTEACHPILEKLADIQKNTPEWFSALTEAENLTTVEHEKVRAG